MKAHRSGFTLIEILVVISILAILAVIIVTAITGSLARAKKTTAVSNIRSCRIMLQQYSTKIGQVYAFPKRLTHCSTKYGFTEEPNVFLDPADPGRGKNGPFAPGWDPSAANMAWYNKDLGEGRAGSPPDELPTSFVFEMADVNTSNPAMMGWLYKNPPPSVWDIDKDGFLSWRECKFYQLRHGDAFSNENFGVDKYPSALFPVLRSTWWATYEFNVDFEQSDASDQGTIASVICETLDGNYFETTKYWEAYAMKRMGKNVTSAQLHGGS